MNYKREDYAHMARLRMSALVRIADVLGKQHAITQLLGSSAWGRSEFEHGPDTNLQTEIRWMAGQDGMVEILKRWCNINNDPKAMDIINRIYPRGFTSKP